MRFTRYALRLKSSDAFYRSYRLQMRTVFTRETKNKARKTPCLDIILFLLGYHLYHNKSDIRSARRH
jgi:hypothetical protein